jgi:lipopolysaccharide export system protein LptA
MRLLAALLLTCIVFGANAQKRVRLKHADYSKGTVRDGVRSDWVIGNVVFTQNQTTIYCDSAEIFRKENSVAAYGNVRITDGDSVTVTARRLKYDGNKRVAYLKSNVVFEKLATATLYTDNLDYYRNISQAQYYNGGKLVDSTNTLTSRKGYYNVNTNMASFKTDVVGISPEHTLRSDTLQYNSKTKIIYFRDVTTVEDKEGKTAVYEQGHYDTNQKTSSLERGTIQTPEYEMKGDKYFLDDLRKFYRAKDNVVMTSKEENTTLYGDDGAYDRRSGIAKIYGHAFVAKVADDGDTLFLSADTLISIENADPAKKRVIAYPNVRIFKSDMQGAADSLVYFPSDSALVLYNQPVLWTGDNQMTSDTIRITLVRQKIDKVFMLSNSFVISQDTLSNFNQIKGRKMVAHFRGSHVHHVDVSGNGESIYYALQEEEKDLDSVRVKITFTAGMNKLICSNMKINFTEGEIDNVSAYKMPDASFIPPHELTKDVQRLKGFNWRSAERPVKKDVVPSVQPPVVDEAVPKK